MEYRGKNLDPKEGNFSLPVDLLRTFAIVLVIMLHAAREPIQIVDQMSPAGVTLKPSQPIPSCRAC
jgi:hypothetical protein